MGHGYKTLFQELELSIILPSHWKFIVITLQLYFFSKNDKYSKGAKHMKVKYFVIKEEVQKQRVSIKHIITNLIIVNPLTKGLPPKTFNEHVERIGIIGYCC